MPEVTVSVFGTSRAKPGEDVFVLAEETGRALAQAGFVVANGGYGGTMLAGAKGAAEAGGTVVGVTCRAFGSRAANEYVTRELSTESLDERLNTLVEMGQAYVVLPGGTGTLLELALVWELKNKKFFDQDKPIILVGDFWGPLVTLIGLDDPRGVGAVRQVAEPADAAKCIREALGGRSEGRTDE